MPPITGQRLREEEVFAAALERPTAERAAFLDQACQGDTALRAKLAEIVEWLDRYLGPVK